MENHFSNIDTFLRQYSKSTDVNSDIVRFINFTKKKDWVRAISNIFSSFIRKGDSTKGEYIFRYHGKSYSFSLISELCLQEWDKRILESKQRRDKALIRTLKLACSMDLVNPRVALGDSFLIVPHPIILYQDQNDEMVMDYAHNLIMRKSDYYELFQFEDINIISKVELCHIFSLLKQLDFSDSLSLWDLLLFSREILDEFSRTGKLHFLNPTYSDDGFNNYWYSIFEGEGSFFSEEDSLVTKYQRLKDELDDFTKNPDVMTPHISYNLKKQRYLLKDKKFGFSEFNLLSNAIDVPKIQEELLSDERYGKCHYNSRIFAYLLMDSFGKDSVYIVGGKVKCNEVDYLFHSWVEINEVNIVVDFNHNLIMNRDKYYELYEAVAISKTEASYMQEFIEPMLEKFNFSFHPFFLNYFGEEMARDIQKNEKILSKK